MPITIPGTMSLEHALFRGGEKHASSAGFRWESAIRLLAEGFGARPDNVTCPYSVLAYPIGRGFMGIVQARDNLLLELYAVAVPVGIYRHTGGDPFCLASKWPPTWTACGELPPLQWEPQPACQRTIDRVCAVLQREDGPNLLGGSQVIVDGGRLCFERDEPDLQLLRDLWMLLPTSNRAELAVAGFAYEGKLPFQVLIVPPGQRPIGYTSEQQAGDYPEGRYELGLQVAAESGDQQELDRLFARRSRAEMWRLGLGILLFMLLAGAILRLVP